jgi:hypothetical protein
MLRAFSLGAIAHELVDVHFWDCRSRSWSFPWVQTMVQVEAMFPWWLEGSGHSNLWVRWVSCVIDRSKSIWFLSNDVFSLITFRLDICSRSWFGWALGWGSLSRRRRLCDRLTDAQKPTSNRWCCQKCLVCCFSGSLPVSSKWSPSYNVLGRSI